MGGYWQSHSTDFVRLYGHRVSSYDVDRKVGEGSEMNGNHYEIEI